MLRKFWPTYFFFLLRKIAIHKQLFFASQQDEMIIAKTFGQTDAIDVTASSVEFDLSALIGRMVGSQRCQTMYSRCTTHPNKIMNEIRKAVLKKD